MMLALKLGRTLEELGRSMSSHEFALWIALWEVDQWGDLRADERAGVVAATVANYAGMQRRQDSAPATPADFMLHLPARPDDDVTIDPDPVEYFRARAASR